MKFAGFGCSGCGLLVALLGAAAIAAAFIPGVVNSAETGTAIGIGSGLCVASLLPIVLGAVLAFVGSRQTED